MFLAGWAINLRKIENKKSQTNSIFIKVKKYPHFEIQSCKSYMTKQVSTFYFDYDIYRVSISIYHGKNCLTQPSPLNQLNVTPLKKSCFSGQIFI